MKRCMIVDDSSVVRQVVKRILDGPDMMVVEAAGGNDALSMCRSEMPDIIVLDSKLFDMSPEDFIRQAMAEAHQTKPHIVICMTQFDVGAIMRAKRAGARGYLLKPFDRGQLLDRFREMDLAA
jgi:two-component system chemotaxis response regulator CheY